MKSNTLYLYPSCPPGGYSNPYCLNFKEALKSYFNVLESDNIETQPAVKGLIYNCLKANVFVLNWVENIGIHRFGIIQMFIAFLCFLLIKLRDAKVIWIFHNFQPHDGMRWEVKLVEWWLERYSYLIIAHSKAACEYMKNRSNCRVEYLCHPFKEISIKNKTIEKDIDVLIWGSITPYKGILEFLEYLNNKSSNLKICIVGKCVDNNLNNQINKYLGDKRNILYENRKADFEEIAELISKSRWVLFPYVGQSISSSGALMDTLVMGGKVVGPKKGAFLDMEEDKLCVTYKNYDDLLNILSSKSDIIEEKTIEQFVGLHTWDHFASSISYMINKELLINKVQ